MNKKMVPKFFSPEEATQTLPLVKQIVAEIQDVFQEQMDTNGERFETLESRLQELALELEDLGGYLKDPSAGLVDFYGIRGSEIVWLCWKVGEKSVSHWHGLTEGFSKRKVIVEWPDNSLNSPSTS